MNNTTLKFFFTLLFGTISVQPGFSQDRLQSDAEIPILAWIGVPERETSIDRFRELRASGININFSKYSNVAAVEKALDIAQQTGVKLLPNCPELKSAPEATVKRLMKHPALFGYHLRDEPNATDFPELATWVKKIQAVDKDHPCYINLFPNYAVAAQLFGKGYQPLPGKQVYEDHVETFLEEVPVPFLSFDHYPVIENKAVKTLRPEWYRNLEIIASASHKHRIPFWAFSLSVAHGSYPVPTVGEIRLQMFSNLAYGAQGLQYFTYWTPGKNPHWDFHHAPIETDGKRTAVYDRIKTVNREIQRLAFVFLQSKVMAVFHTGTDIPLGTKRLDRLPQPIRELQTSGGGAVVSLLEKGKHRFLVIVNRNFQNSMKLTIATDEKVKRVLNDGTIIKANRYSNNLEVDPGDAAIFTWDE